jgi:hypothetical protein
MYWHLHKGTAVTHEDTQYIQHPGGDLNPQSPENKPRGLPTQPQFPIFTYSSTLKQLFPDTSCVTTLRGAPFFYIRTSHDECVGVMQLDNDMSVLNLPPHERINLMTSDEGDTLLKKTDLVRVLGCHIHVTSLVFS